MSERKPDRITRTLSGASFALTIDTSRQRKRFLMLFALCVLLMGAGGFFLMPSSAAPALQLHEALAAQKAENAKLQVELSELKMSLGHERATRESLEREVASQAEALKQANKNLSFYRSHAATGAQGGQ